MYCCIAGSQPFETITADREFDIEDFELSFPENLSHNFINLITQMLVYDPSRRLSIKGIAQHPFFTGKDQVIRDVEEVTYHENAMTVLDLNILKKTVAAKDRYA